MLSTQTPALGNMGSGVAPPEIQFRLFNQPLGDMVAALSYYRSLERAWTLVERNYGDAGLSLDAAAQFSGVSKNHLNVLLRERTSFTFHPLLARYRLYESVRMMRAKDYTLLEVALDCGFGGLRSFERTFQQILGSTPRNYRQAMLSLGPLRKPAQLLSDSA